MSSNGGFDDDLTPGFYSQLLFNDDHEHVSCLQGQFTTYSSRFSSAGASNNDGGSSDTKGGDYSVVITPKMLCFGDHSESKLCDDDAVASGEIMSTQNSVVSTCMEDSNSKDVKLLPKINSNRKRKVSSSVSVEMKKSKRDESCNNNVVVTRHAKVAKKEKLGHRITALQQIVSPFGKTDTASVLHEALGYIRFLQEQVQVLCSPYLHPPSSDHSTASPHPLGNGEQKECVRRGGGDLKSRGLCLVPVELTLHVANDSNGADLWSSAAVVNNMF